MMMMKTLPYHKNGQRVFDFPSHSGAQTTPATRLKDKPDQKWGEAAAA